MILFLSDSVSTVGSVGEIKSQQIGAVWFPQMTLPQYRLLWQPKNNQFDLKTLRIRSSFTTIQLNCMADCP